MKLKNNQSGIAHVAAIMVVIVLVVVGGVGYMVYRNRDKKTASTDNTTTSSSSESGSKAPEESVAVPEAISPQAFTAALLEAVAAKDGAKFESSLSPEYAAFRNADIKDCNMVSDLRSTRIACSTSLTPEIAATFAGVTPTVSDTTYKDGKTGKRVDYKQANKGEPGTNYLSFRLIAKDNTWQVYDYGDVFVPQADAPVEVITNRGQ